MADASAPKRPPITCHVLDTTIGRPGADIPVTLTYLGRKASPSPSSSNTTHSESAQDDDERRGTTFTALTNADGRVTHWTPSSSSSSSSPTTLEEIFSSSATTPTSSASKETATMRFVLAFDTDAYFAARGVRPFFPDVQVGFAVAPDQVRASEHFHVPVLLGPFGYTTYRGS